MATIRFVLRGDTSERDGIPILCRITHQGKSAFISIQEKIHEKYWIKKAELPVVNYQGGAWLAKKIHSLRTQLTQILKTFEDENRVITAKIIKEAYEKKFEESPDFFKVADNYLETIKVYGTRKGFRSAVKKMRYFHANAYGDDPLRFRDLDYTYLKTFENFLEIEMKNKTNTIAAAMKKIRAVFNEAIRLGHASVNELPFGNRKYKIKWEPTHRDWLKKDELFKLENFEIETPKYNLYKNALVFSANVGGLRPSDILQLRWKNFDGNKIDIIMHKTRRQVIVEVNDIGHEILECQRNLNPDAKPDDLIFPILKIEDLNDAEALDKAIASSLTTVNKGLKIVSEKVGIKPISLGMGRHTFGSHAVLNGMHIPVLSKIMGHSSINQTMVYIKITGEDIKDEMQKMNKRNRNGNQSL